MHALPPGFEDLDQLAAKWARPTEVERNTARRTSSMAELESVYATLLPRMPAIVAALNQRRLPDLDPAERSLLWMALSFMEVAHSVELFKEPDPSDAFPAGRYAIREAP
jgi:hypothetical protein